MDFKQFKDISENDVRKSLNVRGKITTVKQTSGPTLMVINDGTSNFTLKAFVKPGVRAYPEVDVGSFVEVFAQINERQGSIEGEVKSMELMRDDRQAKFEEELNELQEARFRPKTDSFSIDSPVLEALKKRFVKVSTIIRRAIVEGRPILLRHDADCDGYSSAIQMERAILGFMREITNGDKQAEFLNYKRAPSKAPFYEYEDSIKDASNHLRDKNRAGVLAPLIIITDNGSTEEDILGINQMRIYGAQVVVIDHHYPGEKDENGKVPVDYYLEGHINPYLEGFDSNVCSGMLGHEMARFIYEKIENPKMIPAMAGILDHVDGDEKEKYIELALKEGYSMEFMENLGEIIYLQSHYLRFMEAREFVDDLFGANKLVQEDIVKRLTPEIKRRYERARVIGRHYAKKNDFEAFYLMEFDGEKGTARGEFPAVGKTTNIIHKVFEEEQDKPIITMTYGSTFMTIRVSDEIKGFSVPDFCNILTQKVPHTAADGGGHEHAGSVKFVEYGREEVIAEFKEYLKTIADKNK